VATVIHDNGCRLPAVGGWSGDGASPLLLGFALGAEVDLLAYLTSRFSAWHYGLLYATIYACFWIGIALGPALAGHLFDHYGDYRVVLQGVVALLLFGAMAAASLPRFERATLDVGSG
jgi:MFS family permease